MDDPPLEVEVGLDYLAARLSRAKGDALVVTDDEALSRAAGLRLHAASALGDSAPLGVAPVPRVLAAFRGACTMRIARVCRLVALGGSLGLLAPGRLAMIQARARGSVGQPSSGSRLVSQLGTEGLTVAEVRGIGGAGSLALATLARIAERGARPDLVDRLELAYRRSLAPRPDGRWSFLVAIVAHRAG